LFVLQFKPLIKKKHKPSCELHTPLWRNSAKTYNNDIWLPGKARWQPRKYCDDRL